MAKDKPTKKQRDGVYQQPGRPGWYISYIDRDGKRHRVHTDAQTKSEAKAIRAAYLTREEQAKILGVVPPGDDLFADVAKDYLIHQSVRLTPHAYARTKGIVEGHLIPYFGGKKDEQQRKIADIKLKQAEKYVTKRLGEKKPATVRKEVVVLKHIFEFAVNQEVIPVNSLTKLELPKEPPGRVRYLQPEELRKVIDHCPPWLKSIVLLAASTGMRRGEILKLKYLEVDRRQGKATVIGKNGERRTVPLNQLALMALDEVWNEKAKSTDYIFAGVRFDYVTGAFARACRQAKIEDFHFHDLRHTAASWMRMSGHDIQAVALILGHKDMRSAMRYQHLAPNFLDDAAASLDKKFMPEIVTDEPKLIGGKNDE